MRKRTARKLRRIADRLDPKPARWYASAWQQSSSTIYSTVPVTYAYDPALKPKHGHRVLADYLTTMDLKKLRP
jgi:hypothetical protein